MGVTFFSSINYLVILINIGQLGDHSAGRVGRFLHPGWNLVVLPGRMEAMPKQPGLLVHPVYAEPDAYWIFSEQGRLWSVSGQALPEARGGSVPTESGWHFVGGSRFKRSDVPSPVELWAWDAKEQRYRKKSGNSVLRRGEGYWAYYDGSSRAASMAHDQVDHGLSTLGGRQSGGAFSVAWEEPEGSESQQIPRPVLLGAASENLLRAQRLRDALFVQKRGDEGDAPLLAYQLEYVPDDQVDPKDTQYLAKYHRVWAYTQGIALAQRARSPLSEDQEKAVALAAGLCAHAVYRATETAGRGGVILGWHFSRNTSLDDWKDARLVTGANAWAVHGLGIFLTSDAAQAVTSEDKRDGLKDCYLQALEGLHEHRFDLTETHSLMTAGWTTDGLRYAGSPHRLAPVMDSAREDPEEKWAYYDVLDAIGYDSFPEALGQRPKIRTYRHREDGSKVFGRIITLTRPDWLILKKRVQAQNVVTEHNLDVLSVLNHALKNAHILGPKEPVEAASWYASVRSWRDHLRRGIFELLWDEGASPIDSGNVEPKSRDRSLGHIVTGGSLSVPFTSKDAWRLSKSHHVAIDNCSWLALSVSHPELFDVEREKLATCLARTIAVFVKNMELDGRSYYGAHYFENDFEDPYIEKSDLQESAYHLEATLGLIAGLLRFAEAHPGHPRASAFAQEAYLLWNGVQEYVGDRGFSYSSLRIQDLATRLPSSTSALWFIDVYYDLVRMEYDPEFALSSNASPDPSIEGEVQSSVFQPVLLGSSLPHVPFMLGGADLSLVQQNILIQILLGQGARTAATQGGKATVEASSKEILAWVLPIAASLGIPDEAVQATTDPIVRGLHALSPKVHNVLFVREGAGPVSLPHDFTPIELRHRLLTEDLARMTPAELHDFAARAAADHTALLVERVLGYSMGASTAFDRPTFVAELTHLFEEAWRGYVPHTIVIHETRQGIDLYHRFSSAHEWDPQHALRGLMVLLDTGGAEVLYKHPGAPGFDWTSSGIESLLDDLPPEHHAAFFRALSQLVAEILLGTTEPGDTEARIAEIKERIRDRGRVVVAGTDPGGDGEDERPDPKPLATSETNPLGPLRADFAVHPDTGDVAVWSASEAQQFFGLPLSQLKDPDQDAEVVVDNKLRTGAWDQPYQYYRLFWHDVCPKVRPDLEGTGCFVLYVSSERGEGLFEFYQQRLPDPHKLRPFPIHFVNEIPNLVTGLDLTEGYQPNRGIEGLFVNFESFREAFYRDFEGYNGIDLNSSKHRQVFFEVESLIEDKVTEINVVALTAKFFTLSDDPEDRYEMVRDEIGGIPKLTLKELKAYTLRGKRDPFFERNFEYQIDSERLQAALNAWFGKGHYTFEIADDRSVHFLRNKKRDANGNLQKEDAEDL